MYDFPANPVLNQEYTPGSGQTYIFIPPSWKVKGTPPAGDNIPEAPMDGEQYARKDGNWSAVIKTSEGGVAYVWDDIQGKPATFPPTLPIAQSGVTNLVSELALKAKVDSPILTGIPQAPTAATPDSSTQIATTAYVQANIATRAPAGHGHPQSEIAGLITDLNAKAPLASPPLTGNPTAPTQASTDSSTRIATTAFVKANAIPEAPNDGKYYVRRNNAWVEVPAPVASPISYDVNGDAVIKFASTIMVRIKPTGLILTKDDVEVFSVSV